jgi:hypothetical protein
MRLAKHAFASFAFLALTAVMGCTARGGPADAGRDAPSFPPIDAPRLDTPTSPPDTPVALPDVPARTDTPAARDAGGRLCASITCTTNENCASMCPPNPMGANCCDTAVGRCYASTMPMCPAPPGDGGMTRY